MVSYRQTRVSLSLFDFSWFYRPEALCSHPLRSVPDAASVEEFVWKPGAYHALNSLSDAEQDAAGESAHRTSDTKRGSPMLITIMPIGVGQGQMGTGDEKRFLKSKSVDGVDGSVDFEIALMQTLNPLSCRPRSPRARQRSPSLSPSKVDEEERAHDPSVWKAFVKRFGEIEHLEVSVSDLYELGVASKAEDNSHLFKVVRSLAPIEHVHHWI